MTHRLQNRRAILGLIASAAFAGVLVFAATPAFSLEAPVTREANPKHITGNGAELRGELNPLSAGSEDRYEFDYNIGGSCENGSVTPEEPESLLPGLTGEQLSVSALVSGLEGNSEYTFCAVELHEGESEKGGGLHFRTSSAPPVVGGESTSGVTPFAAKLEASVNPEDEGASCEFEYGTTATLEPASTSTVACAQALPASQGAETATASVSGLSANKTKYYFRVVVKNGGGTTSGAIEKFETSTAEAPSIAVLAEPEPGVKVFVKVIERFSLGVAVLQAEVNPEWQKTACVFEYGTSPTLGAATSLNCEPELGTGGEAVEPTRALLLGLTPGARYYYRVSATNATGASRSQIESFTPGAPLVESESASEVTPTGAKLEARVNPEYDETSCQFEYGTNSKLESGVTSVPCVPAQLGSYAGGVSTSAALTGLNAGETYYYRVRAQGEVATTEGTIEHFETPPLLAPVIESESQKAATEEENGEQVTPPFEARIEASIDPEYQETTCELEYGTSPTLSSGTTTVACPEAIKSPGGSGVGVSIVVTGLSEKTLYYYRVDATNGTGTEDHSIGEFKTGAPSAPVIGSEGDSEVTPTSVLLEAQINPNYLATPYTFEYTKGPEAETRLLEGHGMIVPGGTIPAGSIATGFGEHRATALLTGLEPDTTYDFRVVAHNATDHPAKHEHTPVVATVTTADTPEASTGAAEVLSPTVAKVKGSVTPDGIPTTYRVQYGGTTTYGKETPAVEVGSGDSPGTVTKELAGLEPGVTYHYRIVASNDGGAQVAYGQDAQFTMPATPPVLTGVSVSSVTQSEASITGTVEPRNLPAHWELLLGPTQGALQPTLARCKREENPPQCAAAGQAQSTTNVTIELVDLAPGTTYHYKLVATQNAASETTEEGSFTTQAASAVSPPISQPAVLPLLATPSLAFPTITPPKEEPKLTNKQKLEKALKTCRKDRNKHKRATCETKARKQYPVKKAKPAKKAKK